MIASGGSTPPSPTPQPEFHSRLVFDGLAQIQTDIIPQTDWSMRVSVGGETRQAVQGIFSARKNGDAVVGMWFNSSSNSSKRVLAARYFSTTTDSDHPQKNDYTTRLGLFLTPYRFGYDNTVYSIASNGEAPDAGIMMGAEAGGYNYTGKLGWFYIYGADAKNATNNADLRDNYTPIYTLRPCTLDGEAGYWCVETSHFYGNTAGQGTLSVED